MFAHNAEFMGVVIPLCLLAGALLGLLEVLSQWEE